MANTEWVLRYRGLGPWRASDMTAGDALVVCEQLRDEWRSIDPTSGPSACLAVLALFVAKATGEPLEAVQVLVAGMGLVELVECLSIEPVMAAAPPAGDVAESFS